MQCRVVEHRPYEVISVGGNKFIAILESDAVAVTVNGMEGEDAHTEYDVNRYTTTVYQADLASAEAYVEANYNALVESASYYEESESTKENNTRALREMESVDYRNFKILASMPAFQQAAEALYPGFLAEQQARREKVI